MIIAIISGLVIGAIVGALMPERKPKKPLIIFAEDENETK